jgi:hypothetical protein
MWLRCVRAVVVLPMHAQVLVIVVAIVVMYWLVR